MDEKAAIDFLRKYSHLEDWRRDPSFTGRPRGEFMDNLAAAYPWYREFPHYIPPMSGEEVYQGDYKRIGLPKILSSEFEKLPLKDIPNSSECILIDIGSHLGRRVTRPFAKEKPNVRVIMIDRLKREDVEDELNYERFQRNDLAGEELRTRVNVTENIEDSVNRLMRANGFSNITYIQKELSYDSMNLGIEDSARGKRVFITGFKNPKGLGNVTAMLAAGLKAEKLYLNNSALEKIPPESEYFGLMRDYLGKHLSGNEIRKVINLIHDPNHAHRRGDEKYNRMDSGQRMFASVLKLMYVLAQKHMLEKEGYSVQIFEDTHPFGPPHYNQPSQDIMAARQPQ